MLKLNSKIIRDYLESKFPSNKLTGYNSQEMTVNSLFKSDSKKHMSINMETGLWQDFKSGRKGNFFHLVAVLEKVHYHQAEQLIINKYFRTVDQMSDIISDHFSSVSEEKISIIEKKINLSCNLLELDSFGSKLEDTKNTILKEKATKFLKERKLSEYTNQVYIGDKSCNKDYDGDMEVHPDFFGRLIIPFIDKISGCYFFQGRTLFKDNPKYLNPSSKETGVKARNILYPFKNEESIVLVEGVLDCLTLQSCGINATSLQGAVISRQQVNVLKQYNFKRIIISMDNDEVGRKANAKIKQRLLKAGYAPEQIFFTTPSTTKDWNDLLVTTSPENLKKVYSAETIVFDDLIEVYATLKGNSSE